MKQLLIRSAFIAVVLLLILVIGLGWSVWAYWGACVVVDFLWGWFAPQIERRLA